MLEKLLRASKWYKVKKTLEKELLDEEEKYGNSKEWEKQ